MSISFQGKALVIDGHSIELAWPVLDAIEDAGKVFVLFDPDSYLSDPSYKVTRRQGAPAIKNLIALTKAGVKLWEAETPDSSDYYYRLTSTEPLVANTFSSYRCEIDPDSGAIKKREFLK
jgi:hypothetical protein